MLVEIGTVMADLQSAAKVRAKEVAQKFSHARTNRETCFTAFPTERYYIFGENIAKGYRTPKDVVKGWMNSEGHRANILNPEFTHIDIGFDSESYSWVQCFGGK